jgi:hypothetical protein
VYYLRHVGFLGAQPPAVKGLRAVEFGDWADQQNASPWRRMREWLIGQFGKDAANQVVPDYLLESMAHQAAQPEPATTNQGFTEGDPVNAQELASQKAALDQRDADLKARETAATAREASFAEREQAIADSEKKQRKADIESFVDDLVKAGQLLPKDKARTVAFMEALPETASVIEFGEDDKPVETPALKVFQAFLKTMPKQVDFSERARRDAATVDDDVVDPQSLANAALEFQEAETKAGRHMSLEVAMQHEAAVEGYRIVKFGAADDTCTKATAATDLLIGTSDSLDKATGELVDIGVGHVHDVRLGGAVTRGQPLTSDANAKAIAAAPAAGSNVRIIGFAAQSGVADDVIRYHFAPSVMQG